MFPLGDSTPRHSFPVVNYTIIVINVLVFIMQLSAPDIESFTVAYSFIPQNFNFFNPTSYFQILTAMFLHGGFLHIISNMWFLHIFGDNIEDRMGHFQYLVFYLLAGFAATMGQYLFDPNGTIPMLGASGAISGAAGAYFVLFRRSTVKTLVTAIVITVVELPVTIFLGYWFLIQLFSGVGSLVSYESGGVAWFAHIGGFVFGYLYAKLFSARQAQIQA